MSVVSIAEHNGNKNAGRHFGLNERHAGEGLEKTTKVGEKRNQKKERLEGSGRKTAHCEVEGNLVE